MMVMDGCWISGGGGGEGGQHSCGQALYFLPWVPEVLLACGGNFRGWHFLTIFKKTLGELNHMLNEGLKSANSP